jgi:hypothetical protein
LGVVAVLVLSAPLLPAGVPSVLRPLVAEGLVPPVQAVLAPRVPVSAPKQPSEPAPRCPTISPAWAGAWAGLPGVGAPSRGQR